MNGIHDIGGTDGFGPVVREESAHVFHEPWQGRIHAISMAPRALGIFNIDEFRHAIERVPPAQYIALRYYERRLPALETLFVEKGCITKAELDAKTDEVLAGQSPTPASRRDDPEQAHRVVERLLRTPPPREESAAAPPRFRPGDRVVVRTLHPKGHTRAPRYIRGKRGVIARSYGAQTFPDASAHGAGPAPQPLYSVHFDAREVWGPDYPARDTVSVDLWDSYLQPARRRGSAARV